ncbi:uncharacterized protein LOC124930280, partial [Impatiens glandulifera]|uniref:uncharacterized protein LOC124930280 n=1 Tax=Impatiens glandulifera TaxID=253017 RepID=UPI001FB12AF3
CQVGKLKKKLRHEENVHRALERAFTRPLGTLPRLPPYLPPRMLELLAEVAVLEEEVVRLEEQVVHFRHGLYQEAIYISSSKSKRCIGHESMDLYDPFPVKNAKQKQSSSKVTTLQNEGHQSFLLTSKQHSLPFPGNNQLQVNAVKNKLSPNSKLATTSRTPPPVKKPLATASECKIIWGQCSEATNIPTKISDENLSNNNDTPNKISENIVKCLSSIFLRMSSLKNRVTMDSLPSILALTNSPDTCETTTGFKDPFNICLEFGKRDIGPYKHLFTVEAASIKLNQKTTSLFLFRRLKLLLQKLASVNMKSLTHQEKLAFWINTYNSCMMNAFLEHGVPDSPDMVVELMQKATINISGQMLNAITIEHFILRLPYHSKYTFSEGIKNDDTTIARGAFGLELSEPLVTFALSCGSWSSPAVRVYTAAQVENELEAAKRNYLQAAIGISISKKLLGIPKLLDWYLLDFAKDMESLLDWICLQLPSELGKEAMKCLESRGVGNSLSESIYIFPYEFKFRYLLHLQ